jgi:hypothetical protein
MATSQPWQPSEAPAGAVTEVRRGERTEPVIMTVSGFAILAINSDRKQ